MRRAIAILVLGLFPVVTNAQSWVNVSGKVTRENSGEGISGASVLLYEFGKATATGSQGTFSMSVAAGDSVTLLFSCIGYETKAIRLLVKGDTLLSVSLPRKTILLPSFEVQATPQKIEAVKQYSIFDYEVVPGYVMVIAYENRLNRSKLMMLDEYDSIVSSHLIPGSPEEIFKDCMGRIFVLTQELALLVSADEHKRISFTGYPLEEFNTAARPCVASRNDYFYFGDYGISKQSIIYSYITSEKKIKTGFCRIRDEAAERMYRNENPLYFDAHGGLKKMLPHGADHEENEELHFIRAILYKPIVAPLFMLGDSLFVFNHYDDKLEVFGYDTRLSRNTPLSYHKDKKWAKRIIADSVTGRVFTLFIKNGIYELKEINLVTGTLKDFSYKIEYPFVDKIRIFDNRIYFLYRPTDLLSNKFLFRGKLP